MWLQRTSRENVSHCSHCVSHIQSGSFGLFHRLMLLICAKITQLSHLAAAVEEAFGSFIEVMHFKMSLEQKN